MRNAEFFLPEFRKNNKNIGVLGMDTDYFGTNCIFSNCYHENFMKTMENLGRNTKYRDKLQIHRNNYQNKTMKKQTNRSVVRIILEQICQVYLLR